MCKEEKRRKWMLARYYVYEQHMGRGRKLARKPRGIRKPELVEGKRGEKTEKL